MPQMKDKDQYNDPGLFDYNNIMPLKDNRLLNSVKYKAKFIKNKSDVDVYLTFNDSTKGEQKQYKDIKNNVPEQCKVNTENFIGLSTTMAETANGKYYCRALCHFYIYKEMFFVEPLIYNDRIDFHSQEYKYLMFFRNTEKTYIDDEKYYKFDDLKDKTFDWFYIGRYRLD